MRRPRDEHALRFRVYVEGDVVDEEWIDARHVDLDALGERHTCHLLAAKAADRWWYVEAYDPASATSTVIADSGQLDPGLLRELLRRHT